jgi:Nif-specific regulatory protein
MSLRSVLWVGSADGLARSGVAESPEVDVAWARDAGAALELPLESFDQVLMDATPEAEGWARELRAAGARGVRVFDADAKPLLAPGARPRLVPAAPRVAGVIGESPTMRATFALVERAQRCAATVLLTGATGVGKEVLARAVHEGSRRAGGKLVAVNCAAFPDTLLESELFGYVRGAFTGADRARDGLFVEADGGTLFLDEIGEISWPLQAKLLRALQEREVRPIGATRSRRVDVRVVAATNRDLRDDAAQGRFRSDLYYRLAVFPIRVPPLRERREDVRLLAEHFLAHHGRREGKPGCRLTPEAAALLETHAWPGNVRELENEMQRALALAEPGEWIGPERLSERVAELHAPAADLVVEGEPLRATLARFEAYVLRRALERHRGRKAETARALGITREGLYKKLKRYGVE